MLLLWVWAPPLLLGGMVLRRLYVMNKTVPRSRFWKAMAILAAFSISLSLVFVIAGPAWLGRHLAIQDIHIFGIDTFWAPFAVLSVVIAMPFSAWWLLRGVNLFQIERIIHK